MWFLKTNFECKFLGPGNLHIYKTLQRRGVRNKTAQNRRLQHSHSFQRGSRGLSHVSGSSSSCPRRMGISGAAKRKHKVQRVVTTLGTSSTRISIRQLSRETQHLPAGMHWSPWHFLFVHDSRLETTFAAVRPGEEFPRWYWRWWTAVEHAHYSLSYSYGALRYQHVSWKINLQKLEFRKDCEGKVINKIGLLFVW